MPCFYKPSFFKYYHTPCTPSVSAPDKNLCTWAGFGVDGVVLESTFNNMTEETQRFYAGRFYTQTMGKVILTWNTFQGTLYIKIGLL